MALSPNHLYATNNVEDYVVNDNIEQLFYYVDEKDKAYHLHFILQQCKGTVISKCLTIKPIRSLYGYKEGS